MYTHSNKSQRKSIHYMDPLTKVTRRQCLAFAQAINKPQIIKEFRDDWIVELGDLDDRTNMEAVATWVGNQRDILFAKDKKRRVQLLRSRFNATMDNWLKHYLARGFEKH